MKNREVISSIGIESENADKLVRQSNNHIPRKLSKVGNTTSTSLQRFSPQKEQNSTVKTAFYEAN